MHPLDPREWLSLAAWNLVPAGRTSQPTQDVARACNVAAGTVRGWRRTGNIPAPALELLKVLAFGLPGAAAGAAWDGWRFAGGELVSPEQECFAPGELLADRMLARQWRRDNAAQNRAGYQRELF